MYYSNKYVKVKTALFDGYFDLKHFMMIQYLLFE